MKLVYGVEHSLDLSEEGVNELYGTIDEMDVLDLENQLVIVGCKRDYQILVNLFNQYSVLADVFRLIQLDATNVQSFNFDYGFTTERGLFYVFQEMTLPFQFNVKTEQEQMALLQMEEHIVAVELGSPPTYFTDRQHEELILKIASAYDVVVTFL